VPLELGAEFVQGRARSLLGRLRKARLHVVPTGQRHLWLHGGRLEDSTGLFSQALEQVAALHGDRPVDEALAERLRAGEMTATVLPLARSYVEGYYAADASRASAEAIGELERASRVLHGDQAVRVEGGYSGALEHALRSILADEPDALRLSTVVTDLRWSEGRVLVGSRKPTGLQLPRVRARAAVVTVPLGVLRAPAGATGAIRFTPRVPAMERAAARLQPGPLFKLLLRFRTPFWTEGTSTAHQTRLRGFGFAHLPEGPIRTWWSTAPLDSGVLTGWAGGPAAQALSESSVDERRTRALQSLSQLFGVEPRALEAMLEAELCHDWQADPFARGGYAYTPVGGVGAMQAFTVPVANTLFFAGEHTHDGGQAGTVHGALETGERAARACLLALRGRKAASF
jgi:monoamine oxidase